MGQIATPLRALIRELESRIGSYAFISVRGGADGPNPKLAGELRRRVKHDPVSIVELHIPDLLPSEPRPKRKDTMVHRVTDSDVRTLTEAVVERFPERISLSCPGRRIPACALSVRILHLEADGAPVFLTCIYLLN
jgi:hypothetical protein